jgi:hypothetical protein
MKAKYVGIVAIISAIVLVNRPVFTGDINL